MTKQRGLVDSYYMGEALSRVAAKLGERSGSEAVDLFVRKYEECIGSPDEDSYSYVWRAAIEAHEQDAHKDGTRAVLIDALRDSALGLSRQLDASRIACIARLLKSEYPTVRRVGIFVCSERYGDLQEQFWRAFDPLWLSEPALWHELYWLIKKNFRSFSSSARETYFHAVLHLKGDWRDATRQGELDEMIRRDVLSPAAGQGDAEIDAYYAQLVARRGAVRDHSDFHSFSTGGLVTEKSPISADEILRMSNADLVAAMRNFVPGPNHWDGPSFRGFAMSLSGAVRSSEDGFASRLDLFAEMRAPFQHGVLRGLRDRWSEDKRDVPWEGALRLMLSVTKSAHFCEQSDAPQAPFEPNQNWVATDIADLVQAAAARANEVPIPQLWNCIEVLDHVLSHTTPEAPEASEDAIGHAINTPRGRAIEALIKVGLALRKTDQNARPETVWMRIEPIVCRELDASAEGRNPEFTALAALYSPNIRYLNEAWLEANLDRIFPSDAGWRWAADGFSYISYFFEWLYRHLLAAGHLKRMIFDADSGKRRDNKALEYVALAYVDNVDDGPLIDELIARLDEGLTHLCWFLWTMRGTEEKAPGRRARVLEFWRRVLERVQGTEEQNAAILSDASVLAAFIDEITPESKALWMSVAPFADVKHHGDVLIEHLARLAPRFPLDVVEIYRAALQSFMPDYDPEDVKACVLRIAEAGYSDEAESLCTTYTERGSSVLKETYSQIRQMRRQH